MILQMIESMDVIVKKDIVLVQLLDYAFVMLGFTSMELLFAKIVLKSQIQHLL